MDDYPGNVTTNGLYRISGAPLLIASDFDFDDDWIRIQGLKQYYDYEILAYLPENGLEPVRSVSTTVHNLSGQQVAAAKSSFRVPDNYFHAAPTGDYFFNFVSRPTSGGPDTSYFRFFMRQKSDVVGNTNQSALPLTFKNRAFQAGALETAGDVDVYSFDFRAGVQYTISLLGAESNSFRGTTLADPILRVFDDQGNFVKGDNNSGLGTNAKLTFTPTSDAKYFLHAIGNNNSTGSYILKSDQFDDYLSSTATTGVLIPDGPAVTGRSDFANDVDWLRVKLSRGFNYRFTSNATISPTDPQGQFIAADSRDGLGVFTLRPDQSADHFVVVSQIDKSFNLTAEIVDDFGVNHNNGTYGSSPVVGAIETPNDVDRFSVSLLPFAKYRFEVKGFGEMPVERLGLALRDQGFRAVRVSGEAPFTYLVPQRFSNIKVPSFSVDVRSDSPTAFGTYQLTITPVDQSAGDTSTRWNVDLVNGNGVVPNAIETAGDVDYHRIKFKANTWYNFKGSASLFQIIDPTGNAYTVPINQFAGSYYYATNAGDYYIVYDSKDFGPSGVGSYSVRITEGLQPETKGGAFDASREPPLSIDSTTLYEAIPGIEIYRNVEFYSDLPLVYQNGGTPVGIPAGQLMTVTLDQWKTVDTQDPDFAGQGEIFSRGIRPNGVKSPWSNIQVNGWGAFPNAIAGTPSYDIRTFAFADGIPSYLSGDPRFPGFEALSSTEQDAFNAAIGSWTSAGNASKFQSIDPGAGNDEAQTMVFKAALASHDLWAFAPGANEGGDIIINTNSSLMMDLAPGKQGYFEVIRAIGTVLGLNTTTAFGRNQSVMGSRTGAGPFASTPLPLDIRAVRSPTDNQRHVGSGVTAYTLGGSDSFYRSITDIGFASPGDRITAEGSSLSSSIDLRPGMTSASTAADGTTPYRFVNSFFSVIPNGIGGEADDGLTGNQDPNHLEGRGGNDVLRGGGGRDWLMGGEDNDYYIFRPGYGDDVIDEQDMGGVDVLRIEGMHNMDSLTNDITFERLGNDLVIRLEMDGGQDREGDSIHVVGMGTPGSRLEAMTLLNPSGAVVRVSLVSVFDQITNPRQRVQLAGGADQYGQLVSPI